MSSVGYPDRNSCSSLLPRPHPDIGGPYGYELQVVDKHADPARLL